MNGKNRSAPGSPSTRLAAILRILAGRGDRLALPAVKEYLSHEDEPVRVAAAEGVTALGAGTALPTLLDLLAKGLGERERAAAENGLAQLCGKAGDADVGVGQNLAPLLAAFPESSAQARCSLLRVFGQAGGPKALAILVTSANDEEGRVRKAALDALAGLADPEATDALVTIAEEA